MTDPEPRSVTDRRTDAESNDDPADREGSATSDTTGSASAEPEGSETAGRDRPADGRGTGTGGEEPHPGAEDAVGDNRTKYVEVIDADGDRSEYGDVYVREDAETFYVSSDLSFTSVGTDVYEKADLARVKVEQHHSTCFVTTAVAGEEETLAALRGFRDGALRPSPIGQPLVAVYEAVSPPIADTLAAHPDGRTAWVVRALVRRCAALAHRREGAGPVAAAALSVLLVALYVLGVAVAAAGDLATRTAELVDA